MRKMFIRKRDTEKLKSFVETKQFGKKIKRLRFNGRRVRPAIFSYWVLYPKNTSFTKFEHLLIDIRNSKILY